MRKFKIMTDRLVGFEKGQIVNESEFDNGEVGWLEHTGHVTLVETPKESTKPAAAAKDKENANG